MTRREVIAGLAATAVIGASDAALKKANIGGRLMQTTGQGDDDEMYHELLVQILSNTLPPDTTVELTLPDIRKYAFANLANLKTLIIHGPTRLTNKCEYFIQGSACETIYLPDVTSCNHFVFWNTPTLKVIHVPRLRDNMYRLCYIGNSSLTDVYIDESTCAEILAIPSFPGMGGTGENSNYANIVFHGSDGNVVYDGSQWVIET